MRHRQPQRLADKRGIGRPAACRRRLKCSAVSRSCGPGFDGNLGVVGGLEVLETLIAHDVSTPRAITVAFFTDEEGARFAPDMLGSLVFVGGMSVETALDVRAVDDDARLGDELLRIGYAGNRPVPAVAFPASYVELHIEQGPILEDLGVTVGVVEGVERGEAAQAQGHPVGGPDLGADRHGVGRAARALA